MSRAQRSAPPRRRPDDRAEARGPGAIAAEAPVTGDTAPWLAALSARSAELNREYGLGDYRRPFVADDRSGLRGSDRLALTVVSVPSPPADDGFAWDDAALSAVATARRRRALSAPAA